MSGGAPTGVTVPPGCQGRFDATLGAGFGGSFSADYHVECDERQATQPAMMRVLPSSTSAIAPASPQMLYGASSKAP